MYAAKAEGGRFRWRWEIEGALEVRVFVTFRELDLFLGDCWHAASHHGRLCVFWTRPALLGNFLEGG